MFEYRSRTAHFNLYSGNQDEKIGTEKAARIARMERVINASSRLKPEEEISFWVDLFIVIRK